MTSLKYKKRIQRYAACSFVYVDREGNDIYQPKTIDIIKDRGQLKYKNTSTICSCSMCAYLKYDRKKFKKETKRLINDKDQYN